MKIAEVITLYETNARTPIPDQMRIAADTIETETDDNDRTKAMVFVQLHESGELQVCGVGETNELHSLGLLVKAVAYLSAGDWDD